MKKNYYKSLNIIFIFMIINTCLISTIKADDQTNLEEDQIDIIQEQSDTYELVYGNIIIAQSFRPTLGNLTRIQLLLSKNGIINSNITIGIRQTITGKDVTNISILSSRITTDQKWIQINFTNIELNTEDKVYFLVCKTTHGDQNNHYKWYASLTDTYTNGSEYYSNNSGGTWSQKTSQDLCFRTYGKEIIKETNLEITYVNGKSSRIIEIGIKNKGETDINNIEINLTIKIGLFIKPNRYYKEYIDNLKAGYPANLLFSDFVVLRPIAFGTMIVTVSANNIEPINKTYQILFLPFYIYVF